MIKKIITNKVIFYLASRYFTYFIQFITSMIIAVKLGPYYMGIWGFILLLLNYFQQLHFGIANSLNVLLVHYKEDNRESNNYIANSLVLIAGLSLLVVFLAIYYSFFGISSFNKYQIGNFFYAVCLIGILQYFNGLFINILRIKNKIMLIAFYQSVIVFLNFGGVFFFKGEVLISILVSGYLIGNLIFTVVVVWGRYLPSFRSVKITMSYLKEILRKGMFLFLYNSCFYFIVISIRTIISYYYSVDEFGYFTFSFSMANAIMLLLDAFSFIIFPKLIDKLSSNNFEEVNDTLLRLRRTYISSSHFLIYLAMIAFPVLLWLIPKYSDALQALNLIALSILMNTNSFGYSTLLIARNKEKYSARISFIALLLNCTLGIVLARVFYVPFSYVILATLITYLFFSFTTLVIGMKILGQFNLKKTLSVFFQVRLFAPYILAIGISVANVKSLCFIPLVVFVIMNWRDMVMIKKDMLRILHKPQVVNL